MDFDLDKHIRNGVKPKAIILEIFIVSASLFIAFFWKDLLTEAINSISPTGQNLLEKAGLGAFITGFLILIAIILSKIMRNGQETEKTGDMQN